MKRRYFLFASGMSMLATMTVGAGFRTQNEINNLILNLKPLADPMFKEYADSSGWERLLTSLSEKGVINSNGDIDLSIIRESARVNQAVEYKGLYYDHHELELYGLAYLLYEGESNLTWH